MDDMTPTFEQRLAEENPALALAVLSQIYPRAKLRPGTFDENKAGADYWVDAVSVDVKFIDFETDGSIVLEVVSNTRTGSVGWTLKDGRLEDHQVLCIWKRTGRFTLFSFHALKELLETHMEEWSKSMKLSRTDTKDKHGNYAYSTEFFTPSREIVEGMIPVLATGFVEVKKQDPEEIMRTLRGVWNSKER